MAFWHDWVSNKRKGSKVESRRGAVGAALVTFKTSEQNICELRDSSHHDLLAVKCFGLWPPRPQGLRGELPETFTIGQSDNLR